MNILKKSMRVIQRFTIAAGLFDICKKTENRLKLHEMNNSLQSKFQSEKMKVINRFPCKNNAKKLPKNTIIKKNNIDQITTFSIFLSLQHRSPLKQEPTPT